MKNLYLSFIFLFSGWTAISQIVTIPDANFKNALLNTNCAYLLGGSEQLDVDANDNGEIEVSEALDVLWLSLDSGNVVSLSGLEAFSNLTRLNVFSNPIALLEISTLSNLTGITINSTSITEINLCGTAVKWLWCQDNPNLQRLYLKNNIVSSDLAKTNSQIPPPLHNFEFYNTPSLTYICYDEGEYPAVVHALEGHSVGVTATTTCDASCSLSTEDPVNQNISLYPNPTSGTINIEVSENRSVSRVIINNLLGQTVMAYVNTAILDISSLVKGTYFVTVETESGKETRKIIKL